MARITFGEALEIKVVEDAGQIATIANNATQPFVVLTETYKRFEENGDVKKVRAIWVNVNKIISVYDT